MEAGVARLHPNAQGAHAEDALDLDELFRPKHGDEEDDDVEEEQERKDRDEEDDDEEEEN